MATSAVARGGEWLLVRSELPCFRKRRDDTEQGHEGVEDERTVDQARTDTDDREETNRLERIERRAVREVIHPEEHARVAGCYVHGQVPPGIVMGSNRWRPKNVFRTAPNPTTATVSCAIPPR